MIFEAWRRFRTRHVVGRTIRALPRLLRKDYGHAGPFTPAQVQATLQRNGLALSTAQPYALAVFCDPAQLAEHQRASTRAIDFPSLRRDAADWYFGGDTGFTASDVMTFAENHDQGGAHGGHGYDSGHSSDGGGGHH